MTKKLWFVNYGPNRSHLWDAKCFDKLRDAKAFAESLPNTPMGDKAPYKIMRHEYLESAVWGDSVKITEVQ